LGTCGFRRERHVDVSGQTQRGEARNDLVLRFSGELSAVPDRDDPDCLTLDSIEETVRCDHDLTTGKLREFGHRSPGLREFSQPSTRDLRRTSAGLARDGAGHRWRRAVRPPVREAPRCARHDHLVERRDDRARQAARCRCRDQLQEDSRVGESDARYHRWARLRPHRRVGR
jgi:hypothetical protein